MKFFLIGLPGSGKTTLGKQLAEKVKLPFVDLDAEIERRDGKTVQEIFAEKKEPYFRDLESKVLREFCQQEKDFVMATGGGAPCFSNNIGLMNASGKTIFLDPRTAVIASRLLKTNLTERPLLEKLSDEQLKDKIEWLRSQRLSFYTQAAVTVSGISVEEIIDSLKN